MRIFVMLVGFTPPSNTCIRTALASAISNPLGTCFFGVGAAASGLLP
jgi:hypothetical protein